MKMRFILPSILALHSACLFVNLSFAQSLDDSVKYQLDIAYGGEKDSLQNLDVYWNDAAKSANVIFFVHGGGWLSGDKKTYRDIAESLAGQGMTVILVNYRLSPRVKFPAHVEDVAAAFAWAHEFVHEYNGDPQKIFLMGHSAGAHLISLIACNDQYIRKYEISPRTIAGVITISGVFEIKTQEGGATREYLGMVFGEDEDVWARASCKNYFSKSKNTLPEFLITWVEAENELIVNENLNIVRAFKAADLPVQSFVFEGNNHDAFVTALQDPNSAFYKKVIKFITDLQR